MSLSLLQSVEVYIESMIDGLKKNDAEMEQNKKDIKGLKDFDELQVAADVEAAVIIAGIQDDIISLKAFDTKEEKEEEKIREDIKELVASDVVQVAVDADAAVIIAGLQAEILALKAANNVQDDGAKIIKKDVKVLQVDVNELKSKEEMEKFDEIANLEVMITRLKEELVALNGGEPILNGTSASLDVDDTSGLAFSEGMAA